VISKRLIGVSFLVSGLAAPAALAAGDADRFARFADGARASGTLEMTLRYSGDPDTCAAADTCGVSGTVVARLRLDATRPVRVRGGNVAVVAVDGTTRARTRDTVAGHACSGHGRVDRTGVGFKADGRGLLLRIGVAAADDPFDTACRAPVLDALGEGALQHVRLKRVAAHMRSLRLRVDGTRAVLGAGYMGTLRTRGTVSLRG
jgi:hypothetical protein